MTERFCGAVDVGGTKISSALFTPEGIISFRKKTAIHKTDPARSISQIIGIILDLERCAQEQKGEIAAVGIVIPGVFFQSEGVAWAPNIPGWDHLPLRDKLKEKVNLPLVIESDRSAYVWGERWQGAARKKRDVVFLAVGTGIGAGIVIDGKLCRGSEDISGAVGWFALDPRFRDEYARMGCFEAEASGDSVARRAIRLIGTGEFSMMEEMTKGKIEKITAPVVIDAFQKGDVLAGKVIETTLQYLAMGIANIVSILNPEMIVLGGGLFQAGEILLEPLRKEFKKWAQPLAARRVELELTRLGEDAGLYGAGKLAWESVEGE